MKPRTATALLLATVLLAPVTSSACGRYGISNEPVDSIVADLASEDLRIATPALARLIALGDEGVRRLERAIEIEQERFDYRQRLVTHYAEAVRTARLEDDELLTEWQKRLDRATTSLAQTRRILTIGTPLLGRLKASVRANTPTA